MHYLFARRLTLFLKRQWGDTTYVYKLVDILGRIEVQQ